MNCLKAQRRWLALVATVLLITLASPAFAAQVAEVGDGFGFDAETGVMTDHDGLSYKFRDDGTIKVLRGSETLSFIGLGVNGHIESGWITKYVTDFSWTWEHDVDAQGNHYVNASVIQTNYEWYAAVSFPVNPALGMKVAYGFKNKMAEDVTNIRLFYLETLDNGATLTYNNQNHTVSWAEHVHLTNETINLTAVVPRIGFPSYWAFNYSDLISDGFKITDLFAGNASLFDAELPSQIVVVVAMTKGNGVLPSGATEWADPTIQSDLVSASLLSESTRKLLAINTSCGPALHVVYTNNSGGTSEVRRAVSLDEGNTWFNDSRVATNAEFPAIVNDSDGNVYIAYRAASAVWLVYYVNGTKNATCGWSYTAPAVIGGTAGDDYGLGWGIDYDGNLWKIESRDSITYENYSVEICSTASNCSVLANWVGPDGNALGYTPLYNPSATRASGAPAVIARTANEVLVFVDDSYNAMACRFNRVGAANYSPDTYDIRGCADIDGPGKGHYWPNGVSATINSSGVVFASFALNDGVKSGVAVTRCAANCHLNASWVALNGSQGYDNLFPNNVKAPVIGVFQDKPVVFFTNNEGTKDLLYRFVSGASWGGFNNATNTTYGSVDHPAACYQTADGFNPAIYLGVAFTNATALTFLNFSDLLGRVAYGGSATAITQWLNDYRTWNYEFNSSFFNASFEINGTEYSSWTVYLVYNGTEYVGSLSEQNGTYYVYNYNLTHPLLLYANDTAFSFLWRAYLNYPANASQFVWNGTANNQNLWFSVYPSAFSIDPSLVLSGNSFLATLNTTRVMEDASTSTAFAYLNASNSSMTADGFNFTATVTAPTIDNNSNVLSVWGYLNVSTATNSSLRISSAATLTVYRLSFGACAGDFNETVANFTVRDEESNVTVNFSMDATFWLWNPARTANSSYSANWTNVLYAEICIYPNWASGQVDSFQNYWSSVSGTSQRSKFLWNVSVSNASTLNYSLFSLAANVTNQTIFTVQDQTGLTVASAIIKALRYFPATNEYVNVAEVLTDFAGKGTTYLRVPDTYYRFVVEKDGETLLFAPPSIITCSNEPYCPPYSVTLVTNPYDVAGYWKVVSSVAVNCSLNNVTRYFTCLVSDPNSVLSSVNLLVTQATDLNESIVCNLTETAFPAVLPCYLGANLTGNVYWAYLWGRSIDDNSLVLLDPTPFDFRALLFNWGLAGVLAAMMLVVTMYFLGSFNPSVAIIAAYVGLIASWMLNLIPLGPSGIEIMLGVGVVVGLLAWKMRT